MAELHKFTTQEAVNTEVAGKWSVETAVTTSNNTVVHIDVTEYHNIIVDCTSTICVLFDTTADTAATDGNNLELLAGIHSLKVPHGLGAKVYFHWLRNNDVNATVRIVKT